MFQVRINRVFQIEGCPESGVAAVDYRTGCGLPPAPTNQVEIKIDTASEETCRLLPHRLDKNADLVCELDSYSFGTAFSATVDTAYSDGKPGYRGPVALPAGVLVSVLQNSPLGLENLVLALEERAKAHEADYAAAWAEYERKQAAKRHQQELFDQVRAREREAQNARDAERAAKRGAGEAVLRDWSLSHGSDLLRSRIEEGFSWQALAVQEYTDYVTRNLPFPPAKTPEGYAPVIKDREAPTLAEIEALRRIRDSLHGQPVTVSLSWVTYTEEEPDYDSESISRCEVVVTVTAPTGDEQERYYLPIAQPQTVLV